MIYRKATFADVEAIYELVAAYAAEGVMLARSRNTLYETLRDMVVAIDDDGTLAGAGGLHIIWDKLAEVRTMAVSPQKRRRGIGAEIVRRLLQEGEALGIEKFFTLTYQPEFFKALGFTVINKEELPHKVWKECIDCPKFPNCDEIAMVKV
ncbi:MAG: N-acetyltransferase [Selenomonas sp.]|nr:N-acetyltransferase [Selenomonas sp.]